MNNNKKGFTLVEFLTYIALFAIIFIVIVEFFFNVSTLNRDTSAKNEIQKVEILLNQHFEDSFINSYEVDEELTIFDSDDGHLVLRTKPSGNLIYNKGIRDILFTDGQGGHALTGPDFRVERFFLQRVEDSLNRLVGIRITVELTYLKDSEVTETFSNLYYFNML